MRLGVVGGVVVGALALPGCGLGARPSPDDPPSKSSQPPCTPGFIAELGRPVSSRAPAAARFTTAGGTIYVMARDFDHGGVLDISPGSTAVYVGEADTPPTYDDRRDTVSPILVQTSVAENGYAALDLPAGRYWLLTSNTADIVAVSCAAGVIQDVQPQQAPSRTALGLLQHGQVGRFAVAVAT
jgi:hypothetical protein